MSRYPRLSSLLVLLLCAVAIAPGRLLAAQTEPATLVERLRRDTNGKVELAQHASTGQIRFIGAGSGETITQPAPSLAKTPDQAARGFLAVYGSLFGLRDQAQELTVKRVKNVDRGRSFVRFQQVYQGVPVLGGELMVQVDAAGNIVSANGEVLPNVSISTRAKVNVDAAVVTAVSSVAKEHGITADRLQFNKPELWIYNPSLIGPHGGASQLVWRFEIAARDLSPIRHLVLIDAVRGNVALSFNQIHGAVRLKTYDANNGTTLPGTLRCDETNLSCAGGDTHEVAAHTYTVDTYNYYMDKHGRDSIDDANMVLKSTVHYGVNYENAFWNGKQMVYGDGSGYPLADDVVAHELTHGVTEKESNLFYYYQSGAINESLSDVFGEILDLTNSGGNDDGSVRWAVGEDITGLGAIRHMSDPGLYGDPDSILSANYFTGEADSGGVHYNSGVNNKAASLLVDGGTFAGYTVDAMGTDKVGAIYYEAATNMLLSGSDYADLYNVLYQACMNLTSPDGSGQTTFADCLNVRAATDAVAMNKQPKSGFNTDPKICSDATQPKNSFFDNLENGAGKWSFAATRGTVRWRLNSIYGAYAHSGTKFLYGDDWPEAIADSTVTLNNGVLVPRNGLLAFAHAYHFEKGSNGTFYDGGVLEYSANGGPWVDAGGLITGNGYDGTLSSSWGNPLGGRRAFAGASHGYITTKVNLSSLAGKTVRFRFRMGVDGTGYRWGWWIDDVRIYKCVPRALGSITGQVTDGVSGISGAEVSLSPTLSTIADATGAYTFTNVYVGKYDISARADGYVSQTLQDVSIVAEPVNVVNFTLSPSN